FSAQSWLENDGDLADQPTAAARPGFDGPPAARSFTLAGLQGQILSGKGAAAALPGACAVADLVILPVTAPAAGGRCRLLDAAILRQTGALAGWIEGDRLVLLPARSASRQWTGDAPVWEPIVLPLPGQ
ncbi:MAG: ComEC family competence protein, partial [Rhodobacteraceae bacterium]|nr:ComEC family competence protein [Paracoccaceae bacterium]